MINKMHKTISDVMRENKANKLQNALRRDTEIDKLLFEMPYNDQKFQELINEQNALGVTIATLTGAKIYQNLIPSY